MIIGQVRAIISAFKILPANDRDISRRQALGLGAIIGGAFSGLLSLVHHPALAKGNKPQRREEEGAMKLMKPRLKGQIPLEGAIKKRRTIRSFAAGPLSLQQLSQILWAAQGITDDGGFKRAAPSAGALYPADIFVVVGRKGVEGLNEGVYYYAPGDHMVSKTVEGDKRKEVALASLSQMWMADATLQLVLTCEYKRITVKYGDRGIRYAHIEIGHIGQNILLQCQALGLSAGIVGAFHDRDLIRVLSLPKNHEPLIILPVGWKA